MSTIRAITEARAAGIQLCVEDDDLVMAASVPPSPAILEQLSRHKTLIVKRLRPGADGWSAEDWQEYFYERVRIAEFDGGISRDQAELHGFSCCVPEWLNRNSVRSPPERCLECGAGDQGHDQLLPFGGERTGHAWLHSRCWLVWFEGRKSKAISALAAMGISAPTNLPNDFGKNGET